MSKTSLNKQILNTLKWVLALALVLALIKSGKLSLADIQTFFSHPSAALAVLVCLASIYAIAFLRWKWLLSAVGVELPYLAALRLGMLGQFFSTVIPGTVGGDLVKAVFVAKRFPGAGLKTISTILVDRVIGLAAMLVVGAAAFLAAEHQIAQVTSQLTPLVLSFGWVIVVLAAVCLLGLALLPFVIRKLPANTRFSGAIENCYQAALAYKDKPATLWATLGISVVMHLLNMLALFFSARAVFGVDFLAQLGLTLSGFIVAGIMGLVAMAVPVAPMGIGVGQLAFSTLFVAVGCSNKQFGASVITNFQLVSIMLNLTGAVFFATYKAEVAAVDQTNVTAGVGA